MAHHQYFESGVDVNWNWPLKAALPAPYSLLAQPLMERVWPQKFVQLRIIHDSTSVRRYNLIFLGGWPSIDSLQPFSGHTADIVIVLRDARAGLDMDISQFQELADHFKAAGVFYIEPASTVTDWFEDVVVGLSHNSNVIEAVERASQVARLYYDKKLQEQTTLAAVTKNLVAKLRGPHLANKVFNAKTRFIGQIKDLKGADLAELLESKQDYFSYLRESGDASDLLEISTAVEERLSGAAILDVKYGSPSPPPGIDTGMDAPDLNAGGTLNEPEPPKRVKFKLETKKKGEKNKPQTRGIKKMTEPYTGETITKDDARYLQANIVSGSNKLVEGPLQPSQQYKMGVQIGLPKKGFQRTGTELDTSLIFPDEKELETTVQLKVITNLDKEAQFAGIKVPRWGDSQTAYFDIATAANTKEFTADIYAYHKNRLIQQVQFTVAVSSNAAEKDAQHMKLIFCARKSLSDLENRTEFAASLEFIPGKKEESTVQGMAENKPVDLFFSGGLKKNLEDMRDRIEEALGIDYSKQPPGKQEEDFEKLLLFLAHKGYLIYKNHLRGNVTPTGPLQIISNDQSFLPVDFIYSYPAPDTDATLCPESKDALKKGTCCGKVKENEAISKLVCPFGFWSCSRIIERHNYQKKSNNSNADYCIVSEPVKNRETLQVLNNTLFASSARVDRAGAGITQSILDAFKKYKVKLSEATDWDNWSVLIGQNRPDSLVLVVHIEKDEQFDINKLELGDQKFLLQTHIGAKVISRDHLDPPPFVVMLGCESTEINNEGFDVASHLMNEGAAIVLSNFTRIKGNHARDIVINLVKFLEEEGRQAQSFGEIMLKLRRYLLSEGLLAGLILLAQGDADWKIKI